MSGRAERYAVLVIAAPALVLLLAACGSARRSEPLIGERQLPNETVALGQQVFDRNCAQCHPGGASGLAPALNNKPLPQWAIKLQVRQGLGAMPAFSDREVSDEQLEAVAEYLVWLRRQGR